MKKKILFVDDEALVLQGLQRMLRPMREEWEMEFVESGPKALAAMAQLPFDVVVSDMRMPGMNGAELLQYVMERYPKTVRLILSGYADQELILKCVGSTHQYLSKPCEAEALKQTVIRVSSDENLTQNEIVKRLVAQMDRLPSIPSLYSQIVEALHDPGVDVETVGGIIGKDMAMTAKILKLVNSAFFGLRRKVTGPAEAANYLGLNTIRSLVLSINAFSQYEATDIDEFPLATLWNHSLDTAAAAKVIAQMEGLNPDMVNECFVGGMLHDIGKLVLAANFSDQFSQVLHLMHEQGKPSIEAEREVFGVNHADVGGHLLALWGLPVPIVEVIALHHEPGRTANKVFTPLTAVHAANAIVQQRSNLSGGLRDEGMNMDYLTELGLAERADAWREAWLRQSLTPQPA